MTSQNKLTVKGQVTIPKDVRDLLGLKAGEPVAFDHEDGRVFIRKGQLTEAEIQHRYEIALANVERVVEKYKHLRTEQSTDEYMAEVREPLP